MCQCLYKRIGLCSTSISWVLGMGVLTVIFIEHDRRDPEVRNSKLVASYYDRFCSPFTLVVQGNAEVIRLFKFHVSLLRRCRWRAETHSAVSSDFIDFILHRAAVVQLQDHWLSNRNVCKRFQQPPNL